MASIETRPGPKGTSYRVVWRDADGRKRTKTWRDQAKAEMWRGLIESVRGDEQAAVRHLARQASQQMTVEKVAAHRLGLLRTTKGTQQTYRSHMENHIGSALGSWPVDTVGEVDCRRCVIGLERKGLSPKCIHNICGWLVSVSKHAEERGWRAGNPMKPTMLPEVVRTDEDEADMFLTRVEAAAMIERMPSRHQAPAQLMLATGLRPAEMRALTVGDVWLDQEKPVVRVTKAIKQNREKGSYVGPPKAPRAVRSVGLPPSAVERLRSHVAGRKSSERLFPRREGQLAVGVHVLPGFRCGGRPRSYGRAAG